MSSAQREARAGPIRPPERVALLLIVLLAWGLRWVWLMEVPPGWRDDDLIELYTFSQEILRSGPRLYFTGASGHEPLYHTLRAALMAFSGLNQATARWMAAACGTLTVLLTWAVGRRLFSRAVGLLAAALMASAFWGLLYSRVAIRHIGLLPWALLALYWGWRVLKDARPPRGGTMGVAVGVAASLTTYYAGRLMPPLLLAALPLVAPRRGRWRRYLPGVAVGMLLAAPMFWAAARLPGADARVSELALPLHEARRGNFRPLLQTAWTTLGMFHARGDPEWLYNISERPVFGAWGATLFYAGLLILLADLRHARARLLLLWLAAGLSPALISLPPSSYGHTILAMPAVYLALSLPMWAAARRRPWAAWPLALLTLLPVAARDLRAYFVTWPAQPMVRFLYRADYRALARHLDAHPEIGEAVVGSFLFGPWDRAAVQTDMRRDDVRLRWVNPERALVGRASPLPFYLQDENARHPAIEARLRTLSPAQAPAGMEGRLLTLPPPPPSAWLGDAFTFGGSLKLEAAAWPVPPHPGEVGEVQLWWRVEAPLPLPPERWQPYPPPPGVYTGPRLKIFAHLLAADGTPLVVDDGLWADPYTLRPGDQLVQWHRFALAPEAPPGPYRLEVGLYDPMTGARWPLPDGADAVTLAVPSAQP